VRGGGVQFVGKLGDIAVAALRVLLMPLGQAVRSVGNGPAATLDMSQFTLPTRYFVPPAPPPPPRRPLPITAAEHIIGMIQCARMLFGKAMEAMSAANEAFVLAEMQMWHANNFMRQARPRLPRSAACVAPAALIGAALIGAARSAAIAPHTRCAHPVTLAAAALAPSRPP